MHVMRAGNSSSSIGLIEFVDSLPAGLVMAEVGCYSGESTSYFVKKMSKLYCVDLWQNYLQKHGHEVIVLEDLREAEEAFDKLAAQYPDIIVKKKGFSTEVVKTFEDGSLDMVYIDANHEYKYVLEDIKAWLPKVKSGGLITGHDYSGEWEGVMQAVNEAIGNPERVFQDSSWMKRVT